MYVGMETSSSPTKIRTNSLATATSIIPATVNKSRPTYSAVPGVPAGREAKSINNVPAPRASQRT